MSRKLTEIPTPEPERYELAAGPAYEFALTRRDFFRVMGAGIIVVFILNDAAAYQESGGRPRRGHR